LSELLSGNREWRTWNSPCEEVDTKEISSVNLSYRTLNYIPLGSILPESATGVAVNFNGGGKIKSRRFKADGLSPCACADFKNC
jgi:hypothetical protein